MNVLDKLLFNLNTIAGVPRGCRIDTTKEFIVIEEDSMMQGLWRKMNADSRQKTIGRISREVRSTIMFATYILDCYAFYVDTAPQLRTQRIIELKKIRIALIKVNKGIENICQTYDADVAGHLGPVSTEARECVKQIEDMLRQLGAFNDMDNIF